MVKNKDTINQIIDHHTIELSHLDKVFFPKSEFTKRDVIDYYTAVAPYFLPHVNNRIIVMHRYPNGITGEAFYQKQIPDYFPHWIHRTMVSLKKGEEQTLVVIQDEATLIYLANQAVLVYHAWLSSTHAVTKPTKIVFDFDPSDKDLTKLHFAAHKVKERLEAHKLVPFVMTTGSRGYHVVAPVIAEHTFETVHEFVKSIAYELAQEYPEFLTVHTNIAERGTKVFIDYLRNSYGQTSVAPYSLRAKEGAPVATPLTWDELAKTKPQQYTIQNIMKRLKQRGDPWEDFEKHARSLQL